VTKRAIDAQSEPVTRWPFLWRAVITEAGTIPKVAGALCIYRGLAPDKWREVGKQFLSPIRRPARLCR